MAWNPTGLNPKYWTRWRYFKEIQLHFAWESVKFFGMCILTVITLVIAFVVCVPRAVYKEYKEKKCLT